MDDKELGEKWPEIKEKLMQKYPHLTREDLALEIGNEKETMERLQAKLNKNWKDIKNMLSLLG